MSKDQSLQTNALGLLGAATLGVVMLSPAMTLYGGFGPSFLAAGSTAPLAFVWALLAILPTALSYTLLSQEHPEAGSAASWAYKVLPAKISLWASWMVFFYYLTNFIIQPVTLGLFFGDFTSALGIQRGFWTYIAGVLLCLAMPAWIVYRGIKVSIRGALMFLLLESAIVAALCATILLRQKSHLNVSGFFPEHPLNSGISQAMIFAILAYCGFDVVSTLAEETRFSRKLIPKATLVSLFIYAAFIIAGIWALSFGASPSELKSMAESGQMPIQSIAQNFWGRASVLVTLTAISASLGLAVATSVGSSRVLFWMGREAHAPRPFAKLHPEFQVPWNALHLIFVCGLIGALISGFFSGPYQSYVWWCSTSTFFAMLTFLVVNAANIGINARRAFAGPKEFLLYLVSPVLGILINFYLLYRCFFKELWALDWATGKSVVAFDIILAAAALLIVLSTKHNAKLVKTTGCHENF